MPGGSPLPRQLVAGLAAQLAEVERRAEVTVAGLALPLLPPCLSRQELLLVLRTHRPVVGSGLEGRMAFLLLLTDLLAASLASPGLADLFPGGSEKSRSALLDRLRQEWTRLFKDLPSSPWAPRPRPETARALHSALARCLALLPAGQWLPAREADTFLGSYGLPPLPGTTRSSALGFTAPLHGFTAAPDLGLRMGTPSPGKENRNQKEVASIDHVDQLQEVAKSEIVLASSKSSNGTFSGRNLFGSPSTDFVFNQLRDGAKGGVGKAGDPPVACGCSCDDCRFVTSPHVARMRARCITCRCHPCVLARSQL